MINLNYSKELGSVDLPQVVAMLIESMNRQASIDLLKRARVARLGYIHDGQPYIVPMLFAYDVHYLYSISTEGQKIAVVVNVPTSTMAPIPGSASKWTIW